MSTQSHQESILSVKSLNTRFKVFSVLTVITAVLVMDLYFHAINKAVEMHNSGMTVSIAFMLIVSIIGGGILYTGNSVFCAIKSAYKVMPESESVAKIESVMTSAGTYHEKWLANELSAIKRIRGEFMVTETEINKLKYHIDKRNKDHSVKVAKQRIERKINELNKESKP